jgi:ribosomal protein L7/L12
MKTIVMSGWELGFQKVKLTEFLKSDLGYSLSDAKAMTDAVLDNRSTELNVEDAQFSSVLAKLRMLGAKCTLKD